METGLTAEGARRAVAIAVVHVYREQPLSHPVLAGDEFDNRIHVVLPICAWHRGSVPDQERPG